MQAMLKRLIILLTFVFLAGCVSAGSNPWATTYSRPAQSAPKPLAQDLPVYQIPDPAEERDAGTPAEQGSAEGDSYDIASSGVYERRPAGTDRYDPYNAQRQEEAYNAPSAAAATPRTGKIRVGIMLPLSGQFDTLGNGMLRAAQLALFDMDYDGIELVPRDTKASIQGAREAARALAAENVDLVLGPLFSPSVEAAKQVFRGRNINMIAFSTDWSLSGGNTYIMGFLPFAQVQRISNYAAMQGLRNIGILAPNTDYGDAVIASYNSMAYRNGLMTADIVKFPPEISDISGIIRAFANYDERVAKREETVAALESYLKTNPGDREAKAELKALENKETAGEPPFDAVLLPVGGDQARSIANLLSFYDLDPKQVRRLGTGLWDDEGLATESALDGAWFAAPSPERRKTFENRYRDTYGDAPPRLATLAYDATALAIVLARNSGGRGDIFTHSALTNPNGFAGLDGIFRFRPDGLVERGLAVLEYDDGTIREIDPAPNTFQQF